MGPADCRKKLQNYVRFSTASPQQGYSHTSGPQAGSGIGTESRHSLEEGGHITCSSSLERIRVLQPLLHRSEEGWGLSLIIDLLLLNHAIKRFRFKMLTIKQFVSQIRTEDWFVMISQGCILPYIHPSSTQEVPEVCFRGRSIPVLGSSVRPVTLTPHFHKVSGCCLGSVATPGHPHTELHRRLVDFSSVRADGVSASRCRPRCPVVISLLTHVNLVLSSLLRIDWSVNPSLCLLNDDSGLY